MVVGVVDNDAAFERGRQGLPSTGALLPRRLAPSLLRAAPPPVGGGVIKELI